MFRRDLEAWEVRVAQAKERALELMAARDLSEEKLAEDQLARDRGIKHLQREELFRQQKLDLLEENEIDDGGAAFFDGKQLEVDQARKVCDDMLKQLLTLRRRSVKNIRMELLRRGQLATFEAQYHKLESELHETERLQRTYARGGTAAGVLGDITPQQSHDIDAAVANQKLQLGSYQSVLKERREVWNMAVSHVQKLKIALCSKETNIRRIIYGIRQKIASMRKRAGRLRAKNENIVVLRINLETKTETLRARTKLLQREECLVTTHDGPFFDTNVWHEGVMQRMPSEKLRLSLQVRPTPQN